MVYWLKVDPGRDNTPQFHCCPPNIVTNSPSQKVFHASTLLNTISRMIVGDLKRREKLRAHLETNQNLGSEGREKEVVL